MNRRLFTASAFASTLIAIAAAFAWPFSYIQERRVLYRGDGWSIMVQEAIGEFGLSAGLHNAPHYESGWNFMILEELDRPRSHNLAWHTAGFGFARWEEEVELSCPIW